MTAATSLINPTTLVVTGTLTPDMTGTYAASGTYNGRTRYLRQSDSVYEIRWEGTTDPINGNEWDIIQVGGNVNTDPRFIMHRRHPARSTYGPNNGSSGTATVTDPNALTPTPRVTLPTRVDLPGGYNAPQVTIRGSITPDATGTYLIQAGLVNGLPWYQRGDGLYNYQYLNTSTSFITDATNGHTYANALWEWSGVPDPWYSGVVLQAKPDFWSATTIQTGRGASGTAGVGQNGGDPDFPRLFERLIAATPPIFNPSYSYLLPLTLSLALPLCYESVKELADRWGYALDLQDANANNTSSPILNDPFTQISRMIALAQSNSAYKVSCLFPRLPIYSDSNPSSGLVCHDAGGTVIRLGSGAPVWTTEPDSTEKQAIVTETAGYYAIYASLVRIDIVLDGGERGVDNPSDSSLYAQDPVVAAAKVASGLSWGDYISLRKKDELVPYHTVAHTSENPIFIFYISGGANSGNSYGDNPFLWDYQYMRLAVDAPSNEAYMNHQAGLDGGDGTADENVIGDQGKTDAFDVLTQLIQKAGREFLFSSMASYNWVAIGWPLNEYQSPDSVMSDDTYAGFLKCYYMLGARGCIVGHFADPVEFSGVHQIGYDFPIYKTNIPEYERQLKLHGYVHGKFSWLEDMLTDGAILPGEDPCVLAASQPGYEFRTGYDNVRVFVRKKNGAQRWLLCAWAADRIERTVTVTIPSYGSASVDATLAGSLYDARIVNGTPSLTLMEFDAIETQPQIPSSVPDRDQFTFGRRLFYALHH